MDKVLVQDKKTGAVKEIKKSLAGDYVGTGKFVLVEAKKQDFKPKNSDFGKEK